MTEQEAKDLFGPFDDEEKVTPEMRSMAKKTMERVTQALPQVNHPAHYNSGKIECIDAIEACMWGLSGYEGFCIGNSIKYLWRWKQKGGVTDLEKAKFYIDRVIQYQKEDEGQS